MRISEAESQVMAVLWASAVALPADDIVAALADQQDWQPATIKTLINRLLNKGAIDAERDGRRYLYRPLLSREDWLQQESASLLDRLFGGRVAPLVAHFSRHQRLSKRDLSELRKLIETLDDDR